jgi:hypothetical protein
VELPKRQDIRRRRSLDDDANPRSDFAFQRVSKPLLLI